jgi:Na+/H+-dicarboxylate symporter
MKRNRLSTWILVGLAGGVLAGYLIHTFAPSPEDGKEIAGYIGMLTDVFLRLIKMVIAPLVFTGVVAGMAHTDGPGEVGRIGAKAILWFVCASVLSLVLGLALSNMMQIGVGVPIPHGGSGTELSTAAFSLKNFVSHIVPQSIVLAMAQNDIIAILLFAIFFGMALSCCAKKRAHSPTSAQSSTVPSR